jgi:hypothetical protein
MGRDILEARRYVDELAYGTDVGAGVASERFEAPAPGADRSPTKRCARRLRY